MAVVEAVRGRQHTARRGSHAGSLTEVGANGEVGEAHETAGESVEENRDAAEMEHPDMAIEITDEHVADITNLANENEDGTPRKTRRRSASSA